MAELIPRDVLEDPEACANFFNNWHSNLPGGIRRIYHQDMLDDSNPDRERRQGLTNRQFHQAIDQALTGTGVNLQRVETLVTEFNQLVNERIAYAREYLKLPESGAEEEDAMLLNLHRLTAPAFMMLRQQGFTHEDLAA